MIYTRLAYKPLLFELFIKKTDWFRTRWPIISAMQLRLLAQLRCCYIVSHNFCRARGQGYKYRNSATSPDCRRTDAGCGNLEVDRIKRKNRNYCKLAYWRIAMSFMLSPWKVFVVRTREIPLSRGRQSGLQLRVAAFAGCRESIETVPCLWGWIRCGISLLNTWNLKFEI